MTLDLHPVTNQVIDYPDTDGQPMADNTLQWEWIATIKNNLEALFAEQPDVFVAGDLLWYPVHGRPDIRRAPDALVAFGRPKGYRGSYMQWLEGHIAPQVVFEVLSPGNTRDEMRQKLVFYDTYGAEEYYLYDPNRNRFRGWRRNLTRLQPITPVDGWTSPRLGVRFELSRQQLQTTKPDGQPFLTFIELQQHAEEAEQARRAAEQARRAAESELLQAQQRASQLAARLRALGIDPDA
jgi:Uma2 family endonuclease